MAKLTLSDMQTHVWTNILDTDSSNRAVDATTVTLLLNRCLSIYKGLQDDRVYLISAATSGASTSVAGTTNVLLTPTNIRKILNIYPGTGGASVALGGKALSKREPWELRAMQFEDNTQLATTDFATHYAVTRQATTTAANIGKRNLHLWRIPDGNTRYYLVEYLQEVTALSGSTDKADTTEAEDYMLCDMVSLIAARLIGHPEEFIADIRSRIPEQLLKTMAPLMADFKSVA